MPDSRERGEGKTETENMNGMESSTLWLNIENPTTDRIHSFFILFYSTCLLLIFFFAEASLFHNTFTFSVLFYRARVFLCCLDWPGVLISNYRLVTASQVAGTTGRRHCAWLFNTFVLNTLSKSLLPDISIARGTRPTSLLSPWMFS